MTLPENWRLVSTFLADNPGNLMNGGDERSSGGVGVRGYGAVGAWLNSRRSHPWASRAD